MEIIRRRIETRSVKGIRRAGEGWDHMLDPDEGIGYIRLTQFTERTIEEMRGALDQLDAAGTKAIVLDLRFNGGGTLDGAIDVADLFLDRGVIVSDRDGRPRRSPHPDCGSGQRRLCIRERNRCWRFAGQRPGEDSWRAIVR